MSTKVLGISRILRLRRSSTSPGFSLLGIEKRNWLILAFLFLNALDCLLTTILVSRGGVEVNPIWSATPVWIPVKMALAVMVASVLVLVRRDRLVRYFNIGMVFIVGWNLLGLAV